MHNFCCNDNLGLSSKVLRLRIMPWQTSRLYRKLLLRVRRSEVVSRFDGFVTRVAPTWPRSRQPVNFESALFIFTKSKYTINY